MLTTTPISPGRANFASTRIRGKGREIKKEREIWRRGELKREKSEIVRKRKKESEEERERPYARTK